MAVNKGEIGIYGILRRDGGDNILAKTDLIQDDDLLKTQKLLNLEVVNGAALATAHIANTNNPHSVTKELLDLGNVDNTSDKDKPVSTAQSLAISSVQNNLTSHIDDKLNPHEVTKAQVGLDKVDNTADADKVVASADKLTTSRKIWGQVFDGTSDISGDITLDGNIVTPGDALLVDLGLSSGTLWMDRNVGASNPEDAGLYFALGETTGYTADEVGKTKQFSWDDYKFGTSSSLTKYNSTDGLVTLETTDDAVLQNVHKYSMPTKEQLQELINGTTSTWTTQNGINGRLFTSKTNGNSIFVPAAGSGGNGSMYDVGSSGYLWSSSLDGDDTYDAWGLGFYSGDVGLYNGNRCYGRSVRGVATPAEGSSKIITLPSSSGTLALDNVVTTTSNGLMSSSDKSKLDGIAENANNYTLPAASTTTLGGIKVGTNLSISDGVLSSKDTTYSAATQSANGLMSSTDKTKLDTVGEGANVKSVNSKTGEVTLTKSDIGLSNVDNTADSTKSVASAAKLTTAHTINGVSFDGSANVTGNFTSGLKEAYLEWGGKDRTSNSPIDACLYDYGRANRLAFGHPDGITIEYSRDGGTTWIDYGLSDEGKQALFSTEIHLVIGKSFTNLFATADCMLRATLESSTFGLYTVLNKFLIFVTTNGSTGCYCRIEGATNDNPTEFKVITTNNNIQGWSGTNTLNTNIVFGTGSGQIKYLRFIFGCTAHTSTSYYGLTINRLYGYGGEGWSTPSTMASTGRLYKIDSSQKATFPATVSAKSFQVNNEEYAEAVTDTEITTMLNDLGI